MNKINKTIIFGSMLVVAVLVMTPSISAVEFNTVVETNRLSRYDEVKEKINTIDLQILHQQIKATNIKEIRKKVAALSPDVSSLGIGIVTIGVILVIIFFEALYGVFTGRAPSLWTGPILGTIMLPFEIVHNAIFSIFFWAIILVGWSFIYVWFTLFPPVPQKI